MGVRSHPRRGAGASGRARAAGTAARIVTLPHMVRRLLLLGCAAAVALTVLGVIRADDLHTTLAVGAILVASVLGGGAAALLPHKSRAPAEFRRSLLRRGAGAALVLAAVSALGALTVVSARLLQGPVVAVVAVAAGIAVGAAAAFAVPARAPAARPALDEQKRVTTFARPLEMEPFGGRRLLTGALLLGIVAIALFVRLWHFNDVGYNSDEAVYAGQGAGIAHDSQLAPFFPVFRAHPLLFQSVVAVGYELHQGDWFGRAAAIAFGALCVLATFELGRLLYGAQGGPDRRRRARPHALPRDRQPSGPARRAAGLLHDADALRADPLRALRTRASGCAAPAPAWGSRCSQRSRASSSAAPSMPSSRSHRRSACACGTGSPRSRSWSITIAPYPLALALSGQSRTGGSFLAWQLARRPNHSLLFYLTAVPVSVGVAVCGLAALALLARARLRRWSWRETLVACWIGVPIAFLELWPVKGFQYLLPLAPVIAVLAAEGVSVVARAVAQTQWISVRRARPVLALALLATLVIPTYAAVTPSSSASFLAGSGGVPGGRETGRFIRAHVPEGATMLAIGPSMANILEFYGRRRAYGLSVSANPLRRNPIYQAVTNPDLSLRRGDIQYIVWDAFSANRSRHFEGRLLSYVSRYRGRAVYTFSTSARAKDGSARPRPADRRVRGAPMRRWALASLALAAAAFAPAASAATRTPATPIRHIVVLMQENHSFDNYFGTYPGADGLPARACLPKSFQEALGCSRPSHVGGHAVLGLGNDPALFSAQYHGGKMDGFLAAYRVGRGLGGLPNPLGYYDARDLPYAWNLADNYVLFDHFFSSAHGGSVWNHMFAISAAPGNRQCRCPAAGGLSRYDHDLRQAAIGRHPVAVLRQRLRPDEHRRQPGAALGRRSFSRFPCSPCPASSTPRDSPRASSTSSSSIAMLNRAISPPCPTSRRALSASTLPASSSPDRRSCARSSAS